MVNDREALDAMYEIMQRWASEGNSISTEELAEIAGDDYTIHNSKTDKCLRKKPRITHKFGRVVETGGHLWVAVGLNDRWLMDDTHGRTIVERYDAMKAATDEKWGTLHTPENLVMNRVNTFNNQHPELRVESGSEAREKYLATGYIPDYISHRGIPRR